MQRNHVGIRKLETLFLLGSQPNRRPSQKSMLFWSRRKVKPSRNLVHARKRHTMMCTGKSIPFTGCKASITSGVPSFQVLESPAAARRREEGVSSYCDHKDYTSVNKIAADAKKKRKKGCFPAPPNRGLREGIQFLP
ncbi:hypothetical protein HPB48_008078 [Haemaphysalis longicornis]|uniref:Uncharacterized protein n=1 Tax=Haemaphysalis longicornis TaxID=44386 RepID=A0A9J6FYD3_HAELO|nr:hypothetical protein HPB48_008078 [Haemaphysalis longicornis]